MSINRRLFIIGASSFGRELESWLDLIPQDFRDWSLSGFLHTPTDRSPLDGYPTHLNIVGNWEEFKFSKEDYVVLGVSDPVWKERIWSKLNNEVDFFTYVAPNATVGKYCKIGEGSIICPNSTLTTNVTIGIGVTLNLSVGIGHDAVVGDFSSIMSRTTVTGKVIIGDKVFIGAGATIIPNRKISDGAIVGAGSVVIRNVPEGRTVFGNPAKTFFV